MPHDLPAWQRAYHYFRRWKRDGTWGKAMTALRKQVRVTLNREQEPSAAVIDSQSILHQSCAWERKRLRRRKKIFGRKRHLLVDTQGLVLAVKVHTADIAERDGAKLFLGPLGSSFPRLSHLFADHGSPGPLTEWIKEQLHWETEIVPKGNKPSHDEWELVDGKPVKKPKPKGTFQA